MGHDQVFKGVLRRFLRDFLELFFPEFAARLDFESVQFSDKGLFKGFPDGLPREPDVVARVKTWEGIRSARQGGRTRSVNARDEISSFRRSAE